MVSSADVMRNLKLATEDLPVVFMVSKEGEGVVKYPGEIIKSKLCEWALASFAPSMGQLTTTSDWSECIYFLILFFVLLVMVAY